MVGIPRNWASDNASIFLIDTGAPSKTNPLVSIFLNQFAANGKLNAEAIEFVNLTNKCIQHLLSGSINDFWQNLRALSAFQLRNMHNIIPDKMTQVWKDGLESGGLIMKLCGSGGGGYITAFAPDHSNALQFLKTNELIHIPVYISN